jgi:hypothetical protein
MILLYVGPSLLDAAPLFVMAVPDSKNTKTGPMVQLYIQRADMHPSQAVREGADVSICGDCKYRGRPEDGKDRACYVNVPWGPSAVWRAFRDHKYEDQTTRITCLTGVAVRVGAYGDPAMVPFRWWENVLGPSAGHTAYTHQWKHCDPRLQSLAMASVDSEAEWREAQARGWRTFRVRDDDQPLLPNEIVCPASDEAGHRTTCKRCLLCDGVQRPLDRRKSIAIYPHRTSGAYSRMRQRLLDF